MNTTIKSTLDKFAQFMKSPHHRYNFSYPEIISDDSYILTILDTTSNLEYRCILKYQDSNNIEIMVVYNNQPRNALNNEYIANVNVELIELDHDENVNYTSNYYDIFDKIDEHANYYLFKSNVSHNKNELYIPFILENWDGHGLFD